MASVTLVNYGLGNIQAFAHIYHRLGISVEIADKPDQLARAERIILPGVGAFDWAMARLLRSGLRETLDDLVLNRGTPVLGVCVGMQMMAQRSEEGALAGLGWIEGDVVRFREETVKETGLPHMGWNDLSLSSSGGLFRDISSPRYYFLHSYFVAPRNPEHVLATAFYGREFAAAIGRGNIFGTQFHPEKSHAWGIDLLRNFAEV